MRRLVQLKSFSFIFNRISRTKNYCNYNNSIPMTLNQQFLVEKKLTNDDNEHMHKLNDK